jgi:hypothetical protein
MNTLVLVVALAVAGSAGAPGALVVAGDLPSGGTLAVADLQRLSPEMIQGKGSRPARGVRLDKILAHFGFTPGEMGPDVPVRDKRSGWKKAVRATAADHFEAVFSCAELADGMGPTRAYVVFEIDGKPVPGDSGPFKLVVPTDKEPSRSVRQLVRLEVIDLRGR